MAGKRDSFWRALADYLPSALIGIFVVAILAPWFPLIGAAVGALVIFAIVRIVNRSLIKPP